MPELSNYDRLWLIVPGYVKMCLENGKVPRLSLVLPRCACLLKIFLVLPTCLIMFEYS